jgi:hypothetical protein
MTLRENWPLRSRLEKQLAKITWLACLIHSCPRPKEEINNWLKKLCGHGIGKIPNEFVKAAKSRSVKLSIFQPPSKKQRYLYSWKTENGKRHGRCLGEL